MNQRNADDYNYIVFKPETALVSQVIMLNLPRLLSRVTIRLCPNARLSLVGVSELYPMIPKPILIETQDRLAAVSLCVMRISSKREIFGLVAKIRGSDIDPSKCDPGTLRRILWDAIHPKPEPKKLSDGLVYYPNFVHVPQTVEERDVCENLFGPYFRVCC